MSRVGFVGASCGIGLMLAACSAHAPAHNQTLAGTRTPSVALAGSAALADGGRLGTATSPVISVAVGAAGAPGIASRDAGQLTGMASPFGVAIQNAAGMVIDGLTVQCPGDCADIEAAAHGGGAPYSFKWEDGSASAKRHVCPVASGTYSVEVSDTVINAAEFGSAAQTATAELTTRVLSCTDAGAPDSGAPDTGAPDSGAPDTGAPPVDLCRAEPAPACKLGTGIVLPEDVTVDVQGATVHYYGGGAALPAGRYRLSYVDGCLTFGGGPSDGLGIGWTINGQTDAPGLFNCFLVGDDGAPFLVAPGTVGALVGPDRSAAQGAFATCAECVAANCNVAPVDFDFKGGKLGVARDAGGIGAIDDLGGESEGGRSPTYRLTRLDACP